MKHVATFRQVGAPLRQNRAWGAVRQSDGTVFMTVWEDRIRQFDGIRYGQITNHAKHKSAKRPNPEYPKRLRHIELVRGGSPCILVIEKAKDTKAIEREIKEVITFYVGGKTVVRSGETWIELLDELSIEQATELRERRQRPVYD